MKSGANRESSYNFLLMCVCVMQWYIMYLNVLDVP